MHRKIWLPILLLTGCNAQIPIAETESTPAAETEPPAVDPPLADAPANPPVEIDVPDDRHCAQRRQARPDPTLAGNPNGDSITEYLDADGCVAVREVRTVRGLTTRIEVQVPGDPQWFPQPPSYVDLTPQPLITTLTVDAQGREIERTSDHGADGSIEERVRHVWQGEYLVEAAHERAHPLLERWAYDDRGNEIRAERHDGNTLIVERTFDGRNRQRVRRTSINGELSMTETWDYQGEHLVERRSESRARLETTIWRYAPDGTVQRRQWRRVESGRTQIVETHDFTTSANGDVTEHYQRDNGDDGIVDAQRWTTNDARGRSIRAHHDDNGDGIIEWTREHRWDDQDRMTWWQNTQNGEPILLKTWRFDDVVEETVWPAPGRLTGTWIKRTWQAGEDHIVEVLVDNDGERLVSRSVTRYAAPNVIAEQTIDQDGDGRVDQSLRQTIDDQGRVTRVESTIDGESTWRQFEFDQHGELAQEVGIEADGDSARLLRQRLRDAAGNVIYTYDKRSFDAGAFRVVRALVER